MKPAEQLKLQHAICAVQAQFTILMLTPNEEHGITIKLLCDKVDELKKLCNELGTHK